MKRELVRLFIVIVLSLVVIGFCSVSRVILAEDSGFTSASGFDENEQDDEDRDNTINGNALFGGNVGIGTMAPTEKLEVAGTVKATKFVGDGSMLTGINGGGEPDGDWVIAGSDMYSGVTGNVGIGIKKPASRLEVKGNIKATSINGNDVARTQYFQVFPISGNFSFATSSTDYMTIINILDGGLSAQFLPPLSGTTRYYRLRATYTDNILDSDDVFGSDLRYSEIQSDTEIFNFTLSHSSELGNWVKQRISHRFQYKGNERTRLEARSGVANKFLQIYGIWIIAEDVAE